MILLLLADEVKTVLEIRFNNLDRDLSALSLISLALLFLCDTIVVKSP